MRKKINVVTLGCSKNLVDSEVLMGQLKVANFELSHDSTEKSDIVIINTCGFINDAKEESIETIMQFINAKNHGQVDKVFVMGCLSERYKNELKKEMPEIDGFYGVGSISQILEDFGFDPKKMLQGERLLTTPKHYAYLKIAEGCDRTCSFCAIPLIRGKNISRSIEDLVLEAEKLSEKGVKELILIAQDLTYYGLDIYKKRMLAELLKQLSELKNIEWIRLQYNYPAGFPYDVVEIMASNPKICNYIDIPFQHISNRILNSMKRAHDADFAYQLIEKFRKHIPDVAIRTTLIVGYPGESEEEFESLKRFVEKIKFDRLGVFTYSPEEDTSAFNLLDDVPNDIKQRRFEEIMEIQQDISYIRNAEKVGLKIKVIIDRKEGEFYIGRTQYDSPEVDNEVIIESQNNSLIVGNFYDAFIVKSDFYDLHGIIN